MAKSAEGMAAGEKTRSATDGIGDIPAVVGIVQALACSGDNCYMAAASGIATDLQPVVPNTLESALLLETAAGDRLETAAALHLSAVVQDKDSVAQVVCCP